MNSHVQHREERIFLETDRHRIVGTLRLPSDGYRSRISDFLNASDHEFISLTDVQIEALDGDSDPVAREFVSVSRRHVVLAMPAGEAPA